MTNPLLQNYGLPHFDRIQASDVQPAVDAVLAECESILQSLEKNPGTTWDSLLVPLEEIRRKIHSTWGPTQHLIGVKNSPALREAYQASMPKMVEFSLRMSQSKPIFEALKKIRASQEYAAYPAAKKRVIDSSILSARLSGIELEGKAQERFNQISQEMSQIQTTFSNNVLDSTKEFELVVSDKKAFDGVAESYLEMWAASYQARHPDSTSTPSSGPWSITLDMPSYLPFMKYSTDGNLRETVYRAYVTRASNGNFDNNPNIYKILQLRHEQAQLLGYKSFAEVSLATKMAGTFAAVDKLLSDLASSSTHKAHEELKDLGAFAAKSGLKRPLENWDVPYYLEKMRQEKFDFSADELRPYFPLPRVLDGLFKLVGTLFGIKVVESKVPVQKWNDDVLYFDVLSDKSEKIAGFYLDPYARPGEKRGGAWMDTCLDRGNFQGQRVYPIAYLVCNGTPPVGDTPSLLSFEEVETLFHEFGHGLQHMLTQIDVLEASGINGIEWDAVELPSQFMENWCYQKDVIKSLTKHIKTGESLPDDLFEKINKAKTFNAANQMVRQINFAMTDMELHHRFDPHSNEKAEDIHRRIAKKVSAMQPLAEDRFLCAFEHIFSGGYSAGYYSYKWAEVLSADAFGRFEEEGLDEKNIARVGASFRDTVLALGGSQHPMEVFVKFRGRKPDPQTLLKHNDLM
ncbi:MAG: M3 family metallopeptidase [Bdellovibrionota bacterium]